jgi:hypothetical protein
MRMEACMRTGTTKNNRSFTLVEMAGMDDPIESMPAAPFGALVIAATREIAWREYADVAKRLLEAGCAWATLHVADGKRRDLERLHAVFDRAIVDKQLTGHDDEMMTGGEPEDSLQEAVHDAVWDAQPQWGEPYAELLVLVIGPEADKVAEKAEALLKSVEQQ